LQGTFAIFGSKWPSLVSTMIFGINFFKWNKIQIICKALKIVSLQKLRPRKIYLQKLCTKKTQWKIPWKIENGLIDVWILGISEKF